MSSTKPVIPVTNLKERIAALEQKNAAERSTSPSPAVGPATGGALKDRIAKFEKKGAVPAPRGRFGLGAPPPVEAQIKRNGELYGNRIPQPVRFASGGSQPPSRSGSSIGFYNGSPELNFSDMNNRRSFSLNVGVNDDDGDEYTPLTSPTFSSPPGSPDSTLPPEGSPTTSTTSEGSSGFKEPIRRAAPFAQVLENARKASEKTEALENMNDPVSPTPFVNSRRVVKQADVDIVEPTPVPQSRPAPPASATFAQSRVTEEPASMLETPFEAKPTPIAPPAIVVESPAPSPAVIVEVAPRAIEVASPIPPQQPVATPTSTVLPESSRRLPSAPPPEELEKPKVRNNKDLTLNLEGVEPSHTSPTSEDENVTPTTANQLLSPAPNSAISSVFSGSSYGSGGSSMISPRPFSMIDISLAERVTPATGRGNIVFVPPSTATMPRKSDLVYFPPTPTELARADETPEPSPQVPQTTTSFSAVVHEKVKETPDPIPHPAALVPQTPTNRKTKAHSENKKWKRMTMMAPPTPMTGELASLIHNAVVLETMVEKGELPWEAEAREERERERREREEERLAAIAAERAKAAADDAKRRAALEAAIIKQREREKARVQAEKEEEEFVTNKLRHTFLIPLSQAQNEHQQTHRKESSASTINAKANRKTMIEKSSTEVPEVPHHPSKSPSIASSKSRFSSFRRLGSVKSVISGRPSDVSMSEDTRSFDSGNYSVDEFGAPGGHGKESSWPSLSPTGKKSASRASSFAGKMFSRSRTKSSGSNLSSASMNEADKYTLPPLPDFIPQVPESQSSKGPRKSTSMKSLRGLVKKNVPPPMDIPAIPQATPSIPTTVVSPSSAGSPSSILSSPGPLKSPDYIGFGTMYPPSDPNARPTSMMSVSSLTSVLPSPLFEEDIFSAFPAVPHNTSTGPRAGNHVSTYGLAPVANGPGAAAPTPSFDSSLLSSATHLKPKGTRRGNGNGAATPKSRTTPLPQ